MYDIYERLLELKDVTTADVCKATGISQSTMSNWKRRQNNLSAKNAQKVADYFGVTVDYLMSGKSEKPSGYYLDDETAAVAQEIFENKELRALFSVGKDMDPVDLRALHSMALALKRKEGYNGDDPA